MAAWDAAKILADSESLTAGEPVTALIDDFRSPVVCIALESLEGGADDTVTVEFDGAAGTYEADQRTLSETQSFTVELPQCKGVSLTSSNGVTYSAEVRSNPK
jgi:hypothetical protein